MEGLLWSVLTGIRPDERDKDQAGVLTWQSLLGNWIDTTITPLSFDAAIETFPDTNTSPEVPNTQEDTVDGMGLVTFAYEDVSTFFRASNIWNVIALLSYTFIGPRSNSAFLK